MLIVFMHSFTCYNGSWEQPAGYVEIPFYKWLARISFAFTLEAFVFISGYLFAFKRIAQNKKDTAISLISNKFKRLFLPSILFSIAYFAIFYPYKGLNDMIYNVINGSGHMWFLPMLFWCFIGGWMLEKIKITDAWKIFFLIALNLVNCISLPLRLSSALSYLVYFYGGFLVYKYLEYIKPMITQRNIIISWLVFIAVFAFFRPLQDMITIDDSTSYVSKIIVLLSIHGMQFLYASSGLIAFYMMISFICWRHQSNFFVIRLAASCFGVYLFQQFFCNCFIIRPISLL